MKGKAIAAPAGIGQVLKNTAPNDLSTQPPADLSKQPGEPPLKVLRQQDLHCVINGDDAGDISLVVNDRQGKQVVLRYRLSDISGRIRRMGVAKFASHYVLECEGRVGEDQRSQ